MTPVQKNKTRIIWPLCVDSLAEKRGHSLSEFFSNGHGNAYVFSRGAALLLAHGVMEEQNQLQAAGKANTTQNNSFEGKIKQLGYILVLYTSSKCVISSGLCIL